MSSYRPVKSHSASALPRIKVKSKVAGLPPQCPGRVRCNLNITIGPVEWNPLHSAHQSLDEKLSLHLQWWGDEGQPTELPLSTTRETFSFFKVTRSLKTLQCYLTDMGALTLTLVDRHGNALGAASIPGIKRLSKENPIREITNIRDGNEGYRLGRLPVMLNLSETRRKQSRSSSRSRSRSNSVRRSRSNSARGRSAPSSGHNSRSSSKENKRRSAPILKHKDDNMKQKIDPSDIENRIDDLLKKSNDLQNQMNNWEKASTQMTNNENIPNNIDYNIPKLNLNSIQLSQTTSSVNYRPEKLSLTQKQNNHDKYGIQIPANLGKARDLPQLKLNIPPIPTDNPDAYSITPSNIYSRVPKSNPLPLHHNSYAATNILSNEKRKDFNELVLNSSLRSNITVDYVPSEADSLLDEEILESIYRVNGNRKHPQQEVQTTDPSFNPPNEQIIDYWLKKGDSLSVKIMHLELPQRKGRPPPSSSTRFIDDSYCVELTMPWVKAPSKRDQIEQCRFQSKKMKNGNIIFNDSRIFEAKEDVKDNIIISLYQKTKFNPKWEKIQSSVIEEINDHEKVDITFNTYSVRLVLARIINEEFEEQEIEEHDVEVYQVPQMSAGRQSEINVPQNSPDRAQSHIPLAPDVPINLYKPQNNTIQNNVFQTTFPVSFLMVVKHGHGLPMVKEGPQGPPVDPLTHLTIRSCLFEEGQISFRTTERSNNPQFNSYHEWNNSIDSDKIELLQNSFFSFELWCATAEQGDQLLGLGRVSTSGLGSILVGGYSLLCSPRYPIIMADGRIPIRDLVSNQIRGHVDIVIAAGTSIQLENFKGKRTDIAEVIRSNEESSNSLIAQSLEVEEIELDDKKEVEEEIPKFSEDVLQNSIPDGISCLISIERCSNLIIREGSKIQVQIETEEGPVKTNWSSSGNFGFQKNCLLVDPLPGKLIFNVFIKSSHSNASNSRLDESGHEYERELGWVEMSLYTLNIGFPQINGWYSVMSVSGDIIGQIKLGLSPSIQTPRTFTRRSNGKKFPEKSPSLQANLIHPERLEESSKTLHNQLKELDDLVRTVKARQFELDERRIEVNDLATQVTPSISRMDRPATEENIQDRESMELPNTRKDILISSANNDPDPVEQYQTVPQLPFVSSGAHNLSGSDKSNQSDVDFSHKSSSDEESFQDNEAFVVEPQLLNSDAKINEILSSRSSRSTNVLSSTRLEGPDESQTEDEHVEDLHSTLASMKSEREESPLEENNCPNSEEELAKMIEQFSSSCRSAQTNLDNYQKMQNDFLIAEENKEEIFEDAHADACNETSIWSGGDEEDNRSAGQTPREPHNDSNDDNLELEDTEIQNSQSVETGQSIETVQHIATNTESIVLDEINPNAALLSEDIEDSQIDSGGTTVAETLSSGPTGLAQLTIESLNRENEIEKEEISRPDRSKQNKLNPAQTKRLAAIFGIN